MTVTQRVGACFSDKNPALLAFFTTKVVKNPGKRRRGYDFSVGGDVPALGVARRNSLGRRGALRHNSPMISINNRVPDRERVSRLIADVAATEIMPRFRRLGPADISEKAPGDLVTAADLAAEERLTAALLDMEAGSVVVGEEAAEHDPGALSALAGDAPVWIVDPVDGTRNFAHGKECFAVIVAYCRGGTTLAGWIHDPINDETVWAAAGEGAWIGARRLGAAAPGPVSGMRGSAGSGIRRRLDAERQGGDGADVPGSMLRYGCVGREYMDLARGTLDFARYGGRLKPWDHAAGVLIHREAGGFSALTDARSPYEATPGRPAGALLLAPDRACWDALHGVLGPG